MSVEIIEVKTRKNLKEFVNFQFQLYKDDPMWVPQLKNDEIKSLRADKNPAFKINTTKFWLAQRNGKTVGRIGGIIPHKYIEKTGEKIGRFTRFESIDDFEVVKALLETAESWAKSQGMAGIDGPLGFTNLDHQAMLIEGFEYLPSVASEYHKPYYQKHIEALGYQKEMDWIEFRLTIPQSISERTAKIAELMKQRSGMYVKTYSSTKELLPYGKQLFELMNRSFHDLFSFVPLTNEMIDFYVEKFLPVVKANFVKLIFDKENELAGFIIPVPSLSKAMQKAHGHLLPFGWYHLMQAYKNPETVDLMLTGLDPKYQGTGNLAILIYEVQKTLVDAGAKYAETTGMIETNQKAIQHWKNYKHIQHKRKRCFIKKFQIRQKNKDKKTF